ncbi:hypothetical protein CGK74_18190 [Thauera propionica]|jgi:hypothetical protein|uniref:Uncharacterized protein n=1 Tax=Thauera propionica TaxID=2019431 RepID=A0A235ETM6_9RHOO|nr:hypothetical protein [Thauera propionica]OYD52406.1 hypothetical protein CGK74_18190 [Thauera propionica]
MSDDVKAKQVQADTTQGESVGNSAGGVTGAAKPARERKAAAQTQDVVAELVLQAEKKTKADKPVPSKSKAATKTPTTSASAPQAKPEPIVVADKGSKTKKPAQPKVKVVRDSFTIPEADYALFAALKQRALSAGIDTKKSELLRAGLALLAATDDSQFAKALNSVERVRIGRPKK